MAAIQAKQKQFELVKALSFGKDGLKFDMHAIGEVLEEENLEEAPEKRKTRKP